MRYNYGTTSTDNSSSAAVIDRVYADSNSSTLMVELAKPTTERLEISLHSVDGRLWWSNQLANGSRAGMYAFEVQQVPRGTYVVSVTAPGVIVWSGKIIAGAD